MLFALIYRGSLHRRRQRQLPPERDSAYMSLESLSPSMSVTCALFGPLREAAGKKNVEVGVDESETVHEILERLERRADLEDNLFDEKHEMRSINVTVNGTNISQLDDLETVVEPGDLIRLAPPVTGG